MSNIIPLLVFPSMHPFTLARIAALSILCLVLSASALAEDRFETELRADVEYGQGGGEKLLLDLVVPKGLDNPAPAIVFVHGGGWATGTRQDFRAGQTTFAASGYVTASVTYRLAPKHVFPAQIEDCKCAIRWLRAHAEELKIDPQRIGAMGGSAGGHLVMMLGAMDPADGLEGEGGWADQSSKVQAVVSIAGPANLDAEYPAFSRKLVEQFLGCTAEEELATYKQASPITYVNKGDAPMLLFQGTKDELVPYDQATQMATALTDAGVAGRIELLLGLGHGWGGEELIRTVEQTQGFFKATLRK